MSTLSNILEAKLSSKYHCEICDYKTSKKSNYKKHCESIRHKNILLSTNINKVKPELSSKIFQCKNCEKIFKERTGLWRHKQKCIEKNENNNDYGINFDTTNLEQRVF